MIRSYISGIGSYLPEKVITNQDLEKMMDTSDEWIVKRTGIKERRWVEPGEQTTSDLGLEASLKAIENAQLSKDDIDMIIFATLSPDHDFPGCGCFLQEKLKIKEVPAFDIRQQCSGFIYGLSMADMYVSSGKYKNVLVVGAEIHSMGLDKTTRGRDISVLFGDGAGACVVSACDMVDKNKDAHIMSTHIHSQGQFAKELWLPARGQEMGLILD